MKLDVHDTIDKVKNIYYNYKEVKFMHNILVVCAHFDDLELGVAARWLDLLLRERKFIN